MTPTHKLLGPTMSMGLHFYYRTPSGTNRCLRNRSNLYMRQFTVNQ